jgi:hypothetical protein
MSTASATFAAGTARTMHAALYGDLALHPGVSGEPDIYGPFYARSAAMGWLTPATEQASSGVWGMNDAEVAPHAGPDPACAAFFQVVLTGGFADGLLPVAPLLAAARDSLARLGTLRLDAIQVLLPERDPPSPGQAASPAGQLLASSLIPAAGWFDHRDPDWLTRIRVTLDGGPDPAFSSAVSDLAERLRGLRPSVFTCESWSMDQDDHLILWPALFDDDASYPHHRISLWGTLPEWSLDSLGWLAAMLSDVITRQGITSPLMFSADKEAPDQSHGQRRPATGQPPPPD